MSHCALRLSALSFAAILLTSTAYAQNTTPGNGSTIPSDSTPEAVAAKAAAEAAQDSGDGFVDKAKDWAERTQIIERLSGDVDGWYPRLGGMTRGGGFAIGPGYRTHLGDVFVDLSAGVSTKAYKSADVNVRWLQAFDERVELWTNYRFEDFPQEDFFGVGPASVRDARTSYDFDSSEVSVLALLKPLRWVRTGALVGYMSPEIGPGTDPNYPSIETLFTDTVAPGLAAQPNFLHTTFFFDVDYRDQRGRPRSGGFYHIALGFWDDRTLEQYDFKRFDANASQYVPLDARKAHVVLGRIGVSYVNNETGERVPFYFLPYVGGVDTVRSFHEFRFKDENALWMTAEYNWTPIKWVSLAAFVDAGKVTDDWHQVDLTNLKKGYGFGFRVHTNRQTFARVDVGSGGGEGWKMFLKLVPSF